MASATYNMVITQGDSVSLPVTMTDGTDPIDLTTTVITSDIKQHVKNVAALDSFSVTLAGDPTTGVFTLSLTPEQTAAFPVTRDDGSNILYYDVQFAYTTEDVRTEFGGTITVLQQITI